ncbi:MAG: hypothetical protein BEN19_08630 [Epulopiscium sp. Nuni2H_MBin003]|nr:MAG: hypothetical protein BEN19_08630 [Epulopiscium sp. Nuni2H_MBin003]
MDYLQLINQNYTLPEKYRPTKLLLEPISNIWLEENTLLMFYKMNKSMQNEGLTALRLYSGYRSYACQNSLYLKTCRDAELKFLTTMPEIIQAGKSEHQLGTAIDVMTTIMSQRNSNIYEFDITFHKKWLDYNCKNFGFILRYPKDKEDITNISYRPYHYRYVGINHAIKMYNFNLCLEEYIPIYKSKRY